VASLESNFGEIQTPPLTLKSENEVVSRASTVEIESFLFSPKKEQF
jgi:hypothetical protein